MTLVTNICLNHQSHFGIVWTSDTAGELRVDVCNAANHRRFSFYGGLQRPYMMAWMDAKNDLKNIRLRLEVENVKNKISEPVTKKTLEKFFSDWQLIVNMNYHPEFFFSKPWKEVGLNYENLPILQKISIGNFYPIISKLTLEDDPCYPEPLLDDDDFEIRFAEQATDAKMRYDACINCQIIPRNQENEYFAELESLVQTPILEQKWLGVIALHFYLRNQIKDTNAFYDFVSNNLLNNFYLIRKETIEAMKTHILVQPESALVIIDRLLTEKDINLRLIGTSLLQDFSRFIYAIENKDLYLKNPYPLKLNTSYAEKLIPLFDIAFEIQETVLNYFQKIKQFKDNTTYTKEQFEKFYNAADPIHIKVNNLNLLLRSLSRLKEPFSNYESK